MLDFELRPSFIEHKIMFNILYGPKALTYYIMLGLTYGVVILPRRKVERCVLDKELFFKNRTKLATKFFVWPSSVLRLVGLKYCSSLSVAWIAIFCLTAHIFT